jgi:hypothetical protein
MRRAGEWAAAQAEADLAATGVRVIDAPAWTGPTKRLGWAVCDAEGNGSAAMPTPRPGPTQQ